MILSLVLVPLYDNYAMAHHDENEIQKFENLVARYFDTDEPDFREVYKNQMNRILQTHVKVNSVTFCGDELTDTYGKSTHSFSEANGLNEKCIEEYIGENGTDGEISLGETCDYSIKQIEILLDKKFKFDVRYSYQYSVDGNSCLPTIVTDDLYFIAENLKLNPESYYLKNKITKAILLAEEYENVSSYSNPNFGGDEVYEMEAEFGGKVQEPKVDLSHQVTPPSPKTNCNTWFASMFDSSCNNQITISKSTSTYEPSISNIDSSDINPKSEEKPYNENAIFQKSSLPTKEKPITKPAWSWSCWWWC